LLGYLLDIFFIFQKPQMALLVQMLGDAEQANPVFTARRTLAV